MVLTPASTIVPGAWAGEMISSTFWGHSRPAAGTQAESLPLQDRGAGAEAARRPQQSCSQGQAGK